MLRTAHPHIPCATSRVRVRLRSQCMAASVLPRREQGPPPRRLMACAHSEGDASMPHDEAPGGGGEQTNGDAAQHQEMALSNQSEELPDELKGLSINDQGFLIDDKSGQVVNSLGATRFDVAVSAMRGLLDPPAWIDNSEHTPGLILSSLKTFPLKYCFSVVGSNTAQFQQDVVDTIQRVCQVEVEPEDIRAVERLKGKFISLQIDAMVRAPELVAMVMDELGKDSRVKMRY